MKHRELPECHSCRRMTAKPAVPEPLVPRPPARELLYLHLPAVYSAELPAGQADTVRCPAVYSAEQAADTAEDNPAVYSADTAGGSPAEYSADTAEDSPAEYSADRKADKGYTEVLGRL